MSILFDSICVAASPYSIQLLVRAASEWLFLVSFLSVVLSFLISSYFLVKDLHQAHDCKYVIETQLPQIQC